MDRKTRPQIQTRGSEKRPHVSSAIFALFFYFIAGVIAAWLAGRVMKGNGFGLLGDAVVGVLGAFAGAYVFRETGAELAGGWFGSVIVGFGGALLLLFVVRLFTGRRHGRRLWS